MESQYRMGLIYSFVSLGYARIGYLSRYFEVVVGFAGEKSVVDNERGRAVARSEVFAL